MTTALEILAKVKANYENRGKTLHAHIIHNAIQTIKKHEREQKAQKKVQAQTEAGGPAGVCAGEYPTNGCQLEDVCADSLPRGDGATDQGRSHMG